MCIVCIVTGLARVALGAGKSGHFAGGAHVTAALAHSILRLASLTVDASSSPASREIFACRTFEASCLASNIGIRSDGTLYA